MAGLAIIGALGGAAYYLNSYTTQDLVPTNEKVPNLAQTGMLKDLMSTGIVLGTIKPYYAAFTDLNEAWKPHSPPDQTPTSDLNKFFTNYGQNLAYEQSNAPAFFFKTPIAQIPLATAEQSSPNIMINDTWSTPPQSSSLGYHPRVYQEYTNQNLYNRTIKNRFTTSGYNTAAGMPTESEVHVDPPDAGPISIEFNPWGPGGLLQNLFNNGLASRTGQKNTDLSSVIGFPQGPLFRIDNDNFLN